MLLVLMGPSSSGKSSLASELGKRLEAEVYTGKDYLRLAKGSNTAWNRFKEELILASASDSSNIIYVATEAADVAKLQDISGAKFVKLTADLEILKKRFASRMGGNVPPPVAAMLERQLKTWENIEADLCIDTSASEELEVYVAEVLKLS